MVIWVKIFKTEKTKEIYLVRLTEICGKVLRIDYCDARPFCSALLNIGYLFQFKYTQLYYVSLNSQMKKLSELMSYFTIGKEVSKRGGEELEN